MRFFHQAENQTTGWALWSICTLSTIFGGCSTVQPYGQPFIDTETCHRYTLRGVVDESNNVFVEDEGSIKRVAGVDAVCALKKVKEMEYKIRHTRIVEARNLMQEALREKFETLFVWLHVVDPATRKEFLETFADALNSEVAEVQAAAKEALKGRNMTLAEIEQRLNKLRAQLKGTVAPTDVEQDEPEDDPLGDSESKCAGTGKTTTLPDGQPGFILACEAIPELDGRRAAPVTPAM